MYKKLTQTTLLALLLISGTLLATSCSSGAPSGLTAEKIEDKHKEKEKELAYFDRDPIRLVIEKLQRALSTDRHGVLKFYEGACRVLLQFRDSQDNREMDRVIKKHYPLLTSKVEEKENAVNDHIDALGTIIDIVKKNETPTYADFEQELLAKKKRIEAEISMFKELLKWRLE